MSCKSNGIKLSKCEAQQWKTVTVLDAQSVKLAGEEAKDRLYELKHKKKVVRVLTVVAYVFFVSLAAIMLSLYYVFLWNGDQRVAAKLIGRPQTNQNAGTKCGNILAEIRKQIRLMENQQQLQQLPATTTATPIISTTLETTTWIDEDFSNLEDMRGGSNFFKKLLSEYPYNDSE